MPRQLDKGEAPAFPRPQGPWSNRVAFAENSPYAFRPNQIICIGKAATEKTRALLRAKIDDEVRTQTVFGENSVLSTNKTFNVEELVAEVRALGLRTEPNYVFFLHSAGCGGCQPSGCGCCGGGGLNPFTPNPFTPNPFTPNPFTPNPFTPNPFTPNAVRPTPFTPNPFTPNNFAASGVRSSSALPAVDPEFDTSVILPPRAEGEDEESDPDMVHVYIYDTGVSIDAHLPPLLAEREQHKLAHETDRDEPDELGDELLDPVAGHGSFIAGIFEQLVPGRDVQVSGIFSTFGDTDVATITARMEEDLAGLSEHVSCRTVVNLSFGAYADEKMYLLAEAIRKAQEKESRLSRQPGMTRSIGHRSLPHCPE